MRNDKLERAMREAGLTQSDLAKKACISTTYMSYILRGVKDPTVSVMKRIAEAVGRNIADIV